MKLFNANLSEKSISTIKESNKRRKAEGKEREWQQNNPIKVKGYNAKRQHKNHKISNLEWFYCRFYFDNNCAYCGMSWENHYQMFKKDFHREHVDDLGANDLSNCVPSCTQCNSEKYTYTLNEWFNPQTNNKYTDVRMKRITNWLSDDYKRFYKI